MQTNDLCQIKLLEIELCVNKWLIFNWIVGDIQKYLESFDRMQMNESCWVE